MLRASGIKAALLAEALCDEGSASFDPRQLRMVIVYSVDDAYRAVAALRNSSADLATGCAVASLDSPRSAVRRRYIEYGVLVVFGVAVLIVGLFVIVGAGTLIPIVVGALAVIGMASLVIRSSRGADEVTPRDSGHPPRLDDK